MPFTPLWLYLSYETLNAVCLFYLVLILGEEKYPSHGVHMLLVLDSQTLSRTALTVCWMFVELAAVKTALVMEQRVTSALSR